MHLLNAHFRTNQQPTLSLSICQSIFFFLLSTQTRTVHILTSHCANIRVNLEYETYGIQDSTLEFYFIMQEFFFSIDP